MSLQIEAKDVYHYISTDDGATFKKVICTVDAAVSSSKSSTETDTRCGILTSTGNNTTSFTGTAVTDVTPAADEMSYMDFWAIFNAGTDIIIVEQNAGATVFTGGRGNITDLSSQNSQGQWSTFQYTVKISGAISLAHVS